MKRLVLSLAVACSLAPAYAQKGQFLYYGSLGASTSGGEASRSLNFGIRSGLGYQVSDHFTLGVQGGLNMAHQGMQGRDADKGSIAAGIFSRYTTRLSDRFYIYVQGDASIITEHSERSGFAQPGTQGGPGQGPGAGPAIQTEPGGGPGMLRPRPMDNSSFGAGIYPGLGMNIGRRWSLNMELDALRMRVSPGNFSAGFNGGQGYRFGVSKYFGGTRKAATVTTPAAN